jgi:hypothetical protein
MKMRNYKPNRLLSVVGKFLPASGTANTTGTLALAGVLAICSLMADVALAQTGGGSRSSYIDSVPVGAVWQDVTAAEGNNLRIDFQAIAYSGGGTANGRTVVLGGGHNNGLNDAVAFLDWRNFETVGWTEDLMSTADFIGVNDDDWAAIGNYLNANYNSATPGGIIDGRGPVALSRHTYDQIVVRSDHFYIFAGVLSFDNPGQPSAPWSLEEGDIWRYDFGSGWSFVGAPIARGYTGHAAAAEDTLTGDIWVHDGSGLRRFDTQSETLGSAGDFLNSQMIESSLNFNPEKGANGTLFGAGRYTGSNWHEYDIATGQQRNMGAVPGNVANTYIVYVDSSYGADYGTYFALVPQDGTLKRWNGSTWDTIATGAPNNNDYVYGRAGFEPVHQVFYWIHNPYTRNTDWKTLVVRPYPFNGSSTPRPTVSLSADPATIAAQGTTTLTWSTTNSDSCTASGDWTGQKPASGSEIIGPLTSNTSYSITCSGAGGTSADSATVTIQGAQPAPAITISANPASINAGGFSVIDWSSSNADSCTAGGGWSGGKTMQGSESLGPLAADTQFSLTCTGAGGEATAAVSVSVASAPPPDPGPGAAEESGGGGSFGIPSLLMLIAMASRRRAMSRA